MDTQHCLQALAAHGITEADSAMLLPLLLDGLRLSPDSDRAFAAFERWLAALETPRDYLPLLQSLDVLNRFCLVTGSSQYFADLLIRNPDDIHILVHPEGYGERETPAHRYREVSRLMEGCDTPEQQRDVLRQWKAREMLQIGVRDLLGLDDMPTAAREFSNLADACVQMALEIAYATLEEKGEGKKEKATDSGSFSFLLSPLSSPLTVFALGKHGGQELNYSSDIDLIFVHADGLPAYITLESGRRMESPAYLAKLAETLISVLSEDGGQGNVFRVDMRLRPEGRFRGVIAVADGVSRLL